MTGDLVMKICVFGSSSEAIEPEFLRSAEHLGASIARRGAGVIFGTGKYGVMGAVARGVRSEGGGLIGVSPEFFKDFNVLVDYGELVFTETMRERKAYMEDNADAFIICAGGIGTFEEFFEVLTLKQLGRHKKPIVIYNVRGYYDHLLGMMDASVSEKFMTSDVKRLFSVAENEAEVFEQLDRYEEYHYNKYDLPEVEYGG